MGWRMGCPARHFKALTADLVKVVPLTASISVHPQMVILGGDGRARARTFAPLNASLLHDRYTLRIEPGHVIPAGLPQDKHLTPRPVQAVQLAAISRPCRCIVGHDARIALWLCTEKTMESRDGGEPRRKRRVYDIRPDKRYPSIA